MSPSTINTTKVLQQLADASIQTYGERAIILEIAAATSVDETDVLQRQQAIWHLAKILRAYSSNNTHTSSHIHTANAIENIVPGNLNLTVTFNPLKTSIEHCIALVRQCWNVVISDTKRLHSIQNARLVEVPVIYGGSAGCDLASVANHHGLETNDIIKLHSSTIYTVLFLGFQAGFAYLHGLPKQLSTPRHRSPREKIAAGSVGIGGTQTGIYPFASPGGWQIIGRVAREFEPLFDIRRSPASLLQAGDQLRFVAVNS